MGDVVLGRLKTALHSRSVEVPEDDELAVLHKKFASEDKLARACTSFSKFKAAVPHFDVPGVDLAVLYINGYASAGALLVAREESLEALLPAGITLGSIDKILSKGGALSCNGYIVTLELEYVPLCKCCDECMYIDATG
jgi:hypothetical protein